MGSSDGKCIFAIEALFCTNGMIFYTVPLPTFSWTFHPVTNPAEYDKFAIDTESLFKI